MAERRPCTEGRWRGVIVGLRSAPGAFDPTGRSYPPRGVPLPPDMFRTHVRPPDATHLAPAPYQRDPDLTTMLPPPGTTQINPQPPYPPPPPRVTGALRSP